MTDFTSILDRGKRRYYTKKRGEWGNCEECGSRKMLYLYCEVVFSYVECVYLLSFFQRTRPTDADCCELRM